VHGDPRRHPVRQRLHVRDDADQPPPVLAQDFERARNYIERFVVQVGEAFVDEQAFEGAGLAA
jgi:hypothetical protein